jgi:hypothetical protein
MLFSSNSRQITADKKKEGYEIQTANKNTSDMWFK